MLKKSGFLSISELPPRPEYKSVSKCSESHAEAICCDVVPTPMIALLFAIVPFLSNCASRDKGQAVPSEESTDETDCDMLQRILIEMCHTHSGFAVKEVHSTAFAP